MPVVVVALGATVAASPMALAEEVGARCCDDAQWEQHQVDEGLLVPLPACVERNEHETKISILNQLTLIIDHGDFHNCSSAPSSSSSFSSSSTGTAVAFPSSPKSCNRSDTKTGRGEVSSFKGYPNFMKFQDRVVLKDQT